jgi:hypothetical protein
MPSSRPKSAISAASPPDNVTGTKCRLDGGARLTESSVAVSCISSRSCTATMPSARPAALRPSFGAMIRWPPASAVRAACANNAGSRTVSRNSKITPTRPSEATWFR